MANCVILHGDRGIFSKHAGPFRIATELRKNNFSVCCINLTAFNSHYLDIELKKFLQQVIKPDTYWVGISTNFFYDIFGSTWDRPTGSPLNIQLSEFINFIKSLNPKTKLVTGGSRKFNLEEFGFVNFEGYVDSEIVEYTQWLAGTNKQINLSFYTGKIYNKEFKHFTTSCIRYEDEDIILPGEVLPIEISRGCIFRCKFCAFPLNGKTKNDGIKDFDILRQEFIQNYEKFGTTKYLFVDDTYNDTVDKIKGLYDNVFSRLPFKINFSTYLRLDLIMRFPESVGILKDSGLTSAQFGIETLNYKSAKAIGKGVDPAEQIKFLKELKANQWSDILISSGFILGLPHSNKQEFEYMSDWLFSDENPLDHWNIHALSINTSRDNYLLSDIDINYEKYGYAVEPGTHGYHKWTYPAGDFDHKYCTDFTNDLMIKSIASKKFRAGGIQDYPEFAEFVTHENLLKIPYSILYKIKQVWQEKKIQRYKEELWKTIQ